MLLFVLPVAMCAQSFIRCATSEYMKALEQFDPSFTQRQSEAINKVNQWLTLKRQNMVEQIITVPVVVHLLWNTNDQNLPDNVIQSQIDVVNQDYTRANADTVQTPLIWRTYAGNPELQFCLAQRTSSNQPTNGIDRKQTSVASFYANDAMKYDTAGGANSWDPNHYLNIWVCNLSGGVLGYGLQPYYAGTTMDGIVVNYIAFGTIGSVLASQYNKGRTTTHEIGHWLGLYHPWGDDGGACWGDDSIADTPNQADHTYGCPAYPLTDACTPNFPGVMFMDYMDYTDDACMNMFSYDQSLKMLAVLNSMRPSILSSPGCTAVGIEEANLKSFITIYPNPVSSTIFVRFNLPKAENMQIQLLDITGRVCLSQQQSVFSETISIPVQNLSAGVYQLSLSTRNGLATEKIAIIR